MHKHPTDDIHYILSSFAKVAGGRSSAIKFFKTHNENESLSSYLCDDLKEFSLRTQSKLRSEIVGDPVAPVKDVTAANPTNHLIKERDPSLVSSSSTALSQKLESTQLFDENVVGQGFRLRRLEQRTSNYETSTSKQFLAVNSSTHFSDSRRTHSMNSGSCVQTLMKQLIHQFDDEPLYQHFFFREDHGHPIFKLAQSETPQPLISFGELRNYWLTNENQEPDVVQTDSIKYEPSSVEEPEPKSTTAESKLIKDLVEPVQTSRKLWCQMPQVLTSGYLEKMSSKEKVSQEAKFEILSSEASYYKSLLVLEEHFALRLTNVLTKTQHNYIFGRVNAVRKASETLFHSLSECFTNSVLMAGMSHLLSDLAEKHSIVYIKYCKNQPLIEKTLSEVRKKSHFVKVLTDLELAPVCQNLNLNSFLILPMQRFLRMPLLVESILKKLSPQDIEYKSWDKLLKHLKKMAEECNHACGELDNMVKNYTAIKDLMESLKFDKNIPTLALLSSSRTLQLQDTFCWFKSKAVAPSETSHVKLILFNDYLILAKLVSNKKYLVVSHCFKDDARVKKTNTNGNLCIDLIMNCKYKKEPERWILGFGNAKSREEQTERWLEALPKDETPAAVKGQVKSNDESEVEIKEETGKYVVEAVYPFEARRDEELTLTPGDLIHVSHQTESGWCFGKRIIDGQAGWFPTDYIKISTSDQTDHSLNQNIV